MRTGAPSSYGSFSVGLSLSDVTWAVASPLFAVYLREGFPLSHDVVRAIALYWAMAAIFTLVAFFAFRIHAGMARYVSLHDAATIVQAVILAELMTSLVLFTFTRLENIPRTTPLIHALILAAGLIGTRALTRVYGSDDRVSARRRRRTVEHIIVIGSNRLASHFIKLLADCYAVERRVIAVLDNEPRMVGRSISGVKILGTPQELQTVVAEFREHGVRIDRVMVSGEPELLAPLLLEEIGRFCQQRNIALDFLPRLIGLTPLPDGQGLVLTAAPDPVPDFALPSYFQLKRYVDSSAALLLLFLSLPVLLVVGLIVLCDLGSPILFWQERLGKNGRPLLVHKFRTMKPLFDWRGEPIPEKARVSKIGRLIRQLHLDELPQLLNVLFGEMSLIGPRPLLVRDQPNNLSIRLLVRPGITGWAQVNGGSTLAADQKRTLDEWYVRNASLALDVRILARTLRIFARGGDLSTISHDARHVLIHARRGSRSKNRLIFINRYYYPDQQASSQILTGLAVELARSGRDVHVMTSRHGHAGSHPVHASVLETIDGVQVHRIVLAKRARSGLWGRLLDYISFYRSLGRALNELVAPGDIVIAKSDPPLLSVLALRWTKRRGAALINWHQDLYPEVAIQLGVPLLKGPLGYTLISMRDRSIREAVANVVVGEHMAKRVIARGVNRNLVHIIPNWSASRAIAPVAVLDNPLRKEWNLENKFVVGYSGNLGRAHEFRTVLNAARQLKSDLRIVFLVIGSGRQFDKLSACVRVYGLNDCFRFMPAQSAEMLACTLSVPDVHWVSLRPACEGLIVPSKIYGIAAAGRPIISICAQDGEIAQLVRQYQCGLTVEPGDAHKLVSTLLYLSWNPSVVLAMGERARGMLEANYTWRHGLQKWQKLIADIEAINEERVPVGSIGALPSSRAAVASL